MLGDRYIRGQVADPPKYLMYGRQKHETKVKEWTKKKETSPKQDGAGIDKGTDKRLKRDVW